MSIANDLERGMLDLINQERVSRGLDPLLLERNLNQSAEDHSEWMLRNDRFSHTGAGGSSSNERMRDAGFDFSGSWRSGENIGYQSERGASGYADDVANIHNALMNSSGHRANILNPNYDYIGIGIDVGDYRGWDVVMVTQNFAATGGSVDLDAGGGSSPVAPPPPLAPIQPLAPPSPDVITGTSGNDRVAGTGQDEILLGQSGNDLLLAQRGDDTLDGGNGNDRLRGAGGADEMNGGSGRDIVDYLSSGSGVRLDLSRLSNNTGDAAGDTFSSIEIYQGSRHGDDMRGSSGDDHLNGMQGNDWLRGAAGDDTLVGGGGNDTLEGQAGTDRLIGKSGADTFVFAPGMDRDVVVDFQNNVDVLDIRAFDLSSRSELEAMADIRNADLLFDLDNGDSLLLKNATLSQVMDDFLI